jgi:hypothetical protein
VSGWRELSKNSIQNVANSSKSEASGDWRKECFSKRDDPV